MYLWAVVLKRLVHLCPYKIAKIEGCCDVHNGDLQICGEEHGSLRNNPVGWRHRSGSVTAAHPASAWHVVGVEENDSQ